MIKPTLTSTVVQIVDHRVPAVSSLASAEESRVVMRAIEVAMTLRLKVSLLCYRLLDRDSLTKH